MKQRPILLAAAAALMSTAAFAQTETGQASAFKALDADKSGSISATEAQAVPVVAQSFKTADKNQDGALTPDEFNASFTTNPPPPLGETGTAPSTAPPPR